MPFTLLFKPIFREGRLESPGEEGALAAGPGEGWEETEGAHTCVSSPRGTDNWHLELEAGFWASRAVLSEFS